MKGGSAAIDEITVPETLVELEFHADFSIGSGT